MLTYQLNGANKLNRLFRREDIQVAHKHVKRCLIPLVIKKIQI